MLSPRRCIDRLLRHPRPLFDQDLHHLQVVAFDGEVERQGAVVVRRVNYCLRIIAIIVVAITVAFIIACTLSLFCLPSLISCSTESWLPIPQATWSGVIPEDQSLPPLPAHQLDQCHTQAVPPLNALRQVLIRNVGVVEEDVEDLMVLLLVKLGRQVEAGVALPVRVRDPELLRLDQLHHNNRSLLPVRVLDRMVKNGKVVFVSFLGIVVTLSLPRTPTHL